jgi:hypothetical protein
LNTKGHHSVSEEAGIPLLKEFFGNRKSLQALYLGNWLTDVSQAVDPVAYLAGSGKVKTAVGSTMDGFKNDLDAMIDEITSQIYESTPGFLKENVEELLKSLKPDIGPYIETAKQDLFENIDFLVNVPSGPIASERESELGKFFRSLFLVNGYFKFVHPEKDGDSSRLNFESFMQVFGRPTDTYGVGKLRKANDRPGAYTQYYPHEHLDRPECLPSVDPPVYAPGRQIPGVPFRIAGNGKPRTRAITKREYINPDMYSYLREDIEMTAGLLAEADMEMKEAIDRFIKHGNEGWDDNDPRWYRTLAKLGHALHQVEDFFAHSNWIELAARTRGEGYLKKILPPDLPVEMLNRMGTTFQKRLKRHLTVPLDDWKKHDPEKWVVTGFFDPKDTLISLAHLTEEAWGSDVHDPVAAVHDHAQSAAEAVKKPETVLDRVQKTTVDTLDFITDPKASLKDNDNQVAKKLKDKFEPDIKKMLRPGVSEQVARQVIRESELSDAPVEVQKEFVNMVITGTKAHKVAGMTKTLYGTIKEVTGFLENPAGWILKWLPSELRKKVKKALRYYAKQRVYEWVGAGRIGCHSLIAKDHGPEPFYKPQKECAIAVHWYIVSTILRWRHGDGGHIDWTELLEYFLRNPVPAGSFEAKKAFVQGYVIHTVRWGEQLKSKNSRYSLEYLYRRYAVDPSQFTWRDIADANFATQGLTDKQATTVINSTLRDSIWGEKVTAPNYAFRQGLKLIIPNQKLPVTLFVRKGANHEWFHKVLDKGWTVFRGYEDTEKQVSGPLQPHTPEPITPEQYQKIIDHGKKLRDQARQRYSTRATNSSCP